MGDICSECAGHGFIRTRHADEECVTCEGFGMDYDDKEVIE